MHGVLALNGHILQLVNDCLKQCGVAQVWQVFVLCPLLFSVLVAPRFSFASSAGACLPWGRDGKRGCARGDGALRCHVWRVPVLWAEAFALVSACPLCALCSVMRCSVGLLCVVGLAQWFAHPVFSSACWADHLLSVLCTVLVCVEEKEEG